jgi:hypothetical protein
MSEPTRKKRKHWGDGKTSFSGEILDLDPLVFTTDHPTSPAVVDLTEFAVGMQQPKSESALGLWSGSFKGRRQLILEIVPFVKQHFGRAPASTIGTLRISFRRWWRLLDKCHDIAPVVSVIDLNDVHGAIQMREGVYGGSTDTFLRCVNPARAVLGHRPLVWTRTERLTNNTILPAKEDVSRIYHALKRRVFKVIDRWESADRLGELGTDWSMCLDSRPQNLPWTEADAFATYKGIIKAVGHPCPSRTLCAKFLGLSVESKFFRGFFDIVFGLYPSRDDVQSILFIFLLRTGWNGATALAIDCGDIKQSVRDHPTSDAHNIVYATKARGRTQQAAIGLKKSRLGPGNLIKLLSERCEPLRDELRKQLRALESPQHGSTTARDRQLMRAKLKREISSPWLFVQSRGNNTISMLGTSYAAGSSQKKAGLLELIQEINEEAGSRSPLAETTTLSDFRDAYISFAYEASGYSWLVAQLAAGHSSVESLKTYLRKVRWKTFGERRVSSFQTGMWNQIKSRQIIEPALLKTWVENGEVTEAQVIRWREHKDRTRVGTGCKDFFHPPKEVVPEHVAGTGCRIQRCTLCRHAVIFDDSMDLLARRLAELLYLQGTIPLTSWNQSSFPLEISATQIALKNFNSADVEGRLSHWQGSIRSGMHIPLQMEGSYGANV